MFYATIPEKLGFFSILNKIFEKVSYGQESFERKDLEDIVFPYVFLRSQTEPQEDEAPRDLLSIFKSLIDSDILKVEARLEPEELDCKINGKFFDKIDELEILKKIKISAEFNNHKLKAYLLIEKMLEIVKDFKFEARNSIQNFVIRAMEAFSHYVVFRNLGLPLSKLKESGVVEYATPRTMLYKFLEASRQYPQFIALLQKNEEIQKKKYKLLKDAEVFEVFVFPADALGELAVTIKEDFRDERAFEEIGVWFPERVYYCEIEECKKLVAGSKKSRPDPCYGIDAFHHEKKDMREGVVILFHSNFSSAIKHISEYFVVHVLRRLISQDNLFGFLAHQVFFEDKEIDIAAIVLFKNSAKIFPIEVQLSSDIEIEKTREKFQKFGELLKNLESEYSIEIRNLFVTFEEPKKERCDNFLIVHISKLEELIKELIYSEATQRT